MNPVSLVPHPGPDPEPRAVAIPQYASFAVPRAGTPEAALVARGAVGPVRRVGPQALLSSFLAAPRNRVARAADVARRPHAPSEARRRQIARGDFLVVLVEADAAGPVAFERHFYADHVAGPKPRSRPRFSGPRHASGGPVAPRPVRRAERRRIVVARRREPHGHVATRGPPNLPLPAPGVGSGGVARRGVDDIVVVAFRFDDRRVFFLLFPRGVRR
mmetsp:Transcript_31977/g.96184  ORF Transcript_31977/g.96184 Transcript_31977/m.96184 type:complete len:217 (-) Transcript_31977:35-685(-)